MAMVPAKGRNNPYVDYDHEHYSTYDDHDHDKGRYLPRHYSPTYHNSIHQHEYTQHNTQHNVYVQQNIMHKKRGVGCNTETLTKTLLCTIVVEQGRNVPSATTTAHAKATISRKNNVVNPILRHIIEEESGIKSAKVEEHLKIIQERKRQELHDYIVVCVQRLQTKHDLPERPRTEEPCEVQQIVRETLRRWRD
eukprot:753470-Hanusia_phi.AAC.1